MRDVWNQCKALYVINPKEIHAYRVMPYACGDYIHDFVVVTYQSFGLDKKTPEQSSDVFFGDP